MPIDLSHTSFEREARAEGRAEGRAEARRQAVRRIVVSRFDDTELADRAAGVPEGLLEDAIEVTATAAGAAEVTRWLEAQRA